MPRYTLGEPNPDSLSTMRVRIGLSQSAYAKNIPYIEVCDFIPVPSRTLYIKHVIVVGTLLILYLFGRLYVLQKIVLNLQMTPHRILLITVPYYLVPNMFHKIVIDNNILSTLKALRNILAFVANRNQSLLP